MNSSNSSALRILVVGESWIKHIIHLKGFDEFHSTEYEEGAGVFLGALGDAGYDITYIRAHEVSMRFPTTRADLDQFDVVILSDIGSNSFLLCDETWHRSERTVNRLSLIAEYVESFDLPMIINRCGVLTGPWQMGKVDQGFMVLWMARHLRLLALTRIVSHRGSASAISSGMSPPMVSAMYCLPSCR